MLVFVVFIIMPIFMLGASALTYYICKSKKWEVTEMARNEALALILRQHKNNNSDLGIDDKYLEKRVIEVQMDLFVAKIEREMEKHQDDNVLLFRPHKAKRAR